MAIDQASFQLLMASIQRFIAGRLVPAEDGVEENDEVPADVVEDMKAIGLFGLAIPEEYGGVGLSMAQECADWLEATAGIAQGVGKDGFGASAD
ncbi:acyl-CoA dehydrogenase family protein [Paraburkholderia sp. J63]|uniref:acyl-CoA dehydrogenase family protein n=1 Tax=Paraburkholderia sp. J63 TaxID=2805434 RepID=UPI0039F5560F